MGLLVVIGPISVSLLLWHRKGLRVQEIVHRARIAIVVAYGVLVVISVTFLL